jgi:dihydroorotate dehydrogenase (NAD+) catalytic subunit
VIDLTTRLGALTLANPVMPASGTFAEGLTQLFDIDRLGAVVLKTITPEPRSGNPLPRVAELDGGMLNAIGIPSKGLDGFLAETLPRYAGLGAPVVASLSADTADAFAAAARRLCVPGVAAIEANISCPNIEADGRAFAMWPDDTARVVAKLRAAVDRPLWVKLTPNTGDIAAIARAAEAAGADALVVANTILAMAIDPETFRPRLGNVMGGLSGPAVKPIMLRLAYQCARAVAIPIIGCGGIARAEDAVEFLLAGCSAVQVGTVSFVRPLALPEIVDGLAAFCRRRGIARVAELIGALDDRPFAAPAPAQLRGVPA